MGTGKQRTSLAVRVRVELAIDPARAEPAAELPAIGQAAVRARVIVRVAAPELAIAQAAGRELGIDPVVAEPEIDPVAAPELAIVPVVAEPALLTDRAVVLALVPVEVELVLDPVAVPVRTKLVTAPHRRGLVPVPKRVEDLAAAAETTRDPAATEAEKAWAAAVTAVAVAAVLQ